MRGNQANKGTFFPHKTPAKCEQLLIYAAWEFSAVCETVLRRVNLTNKQFRVTKQKSAGGNNTERSDFIFLLRHRKLPESCQEEEGPLSCGSDSLKCSCLCHTLKPKCDCSWRRVIYDWTSCFLGSCSAPIPLNRVEVAKNPLRTTLSSCSPCTDIFCCCCVNSCGHSVEHVVAADSSSAG